ncbi:hypothetical protein [Pontiella agarivorans]|uniref:Uncharacterized protein n=1 Tax=Pontiella agarivorans TaxID=3038953 RepID=A0ABU5N1G5_9BACT|nr:hypothetical protein [Pontiella agarivorans]MDZ8120248.1 hypothetical protein [Pontiella agarivorans]
MHRLMQKVRLAMEERSFNTMTVVRMQGEADAKEHGEVYAASLIGLYVLLQADPGRDDVRFVIGRLRDHDSQGTKYPALVDCTTGSDAGGGFKSRV